MIETERRLPLSGAHNFRDLGGYRTVDGRATRWGQLFRSDALHELTAGDVELLRQAGLTTIIDLRTSLESERGGRGLLGAEAMRYVNVSVTPSEGAESTGGTANFHPVLADRYLWYLEVGRASLVEALSLVADPAAHPLVFHCAAGKDRTGVLAALVLDIIGVERQTIVADYLLTATAMERIMDRFRRDPVLGSRMSEIPPHAFTVETATMQTFLDRLEEQYGGARGWARQAGFAERELDAMSEQLLA